MEDFLTFFDRIIPLRFATGPTLTYRSHMPIDKMDLQLDRLLVETRGKGLLTKNGIILLLTSYST